MRAFGALEDQSRRVIPAAFEHPTSASELVVGKINVSLMARVIFHYVQFARELLRARRGVERTKRRMESKGIPIFKSNFPPLLFTIVRKLVNVLFDTDIGTCKNR